MEDDTPEHDREQPTQPHVPQLPATCAQRAELYVRQAQAILRAARRFARMADRDTEYLYVPHAPLSRPADRHDRRRGSRRPLPDMQLLYHRHPGAAERPHADRSAASERAKGGPNDLIQAHGDERAYAHCHPDGHAIGSSNGHA